MTNLTLWGYGLQSPLKTWNENNRRNHVHLENNHRKIITLEEIEILKAASSKYLINNIIAGQNDPMYKIVPSSLIWTPRSTAQTKQQKKFRNATITIIRDLNFNCQMPKPGDRRNYKACWKCRVNDERPTGKKTQLVSGTTVEK